MTVTAVSHDGFEITFDRTDENGNSTELLMPEPGALLQPNHRTKAWFMDTSDAPFTKRRR